MGKGAPQVSSELMTEQRVVSPADLLEALRPDAPTWNPGAAVTDPHRAYFAFRGQRDARWGLESSVFRRVGAQPPAWAAALSKPEAHQDPRLGELLLLRRFLRQADRHGLPIPEDSQSLRSTPLLTRAARSPRFPEDFILSPLALAQHYGVHTRLLDWSWRPLIAAYFAAKSALETRGTRASHFAVWALNLDGFQDLSELHARKKREAASPRLSVVTAPQAAIPNLRAQLGLFTLDRAVVPPPLDEALLDVAAQVGVARLKDQLPLLRKFVVPSRFAGATLRLLSLHGVSAASVYPSYDGVVESIREVSLWRDR